MLFFGMINGGNTTLLLAGAGGQIDGRDMMLLLSAGRWFGCGASLGGTLCDIINLIVRLFPGTFLHTISS
jgi:hypothetical protein